MLNRSVAPAQHPLQFKDITLPISTKLVNGTNIFCFIGGKEDVFKIELIISTSSSLNANSAVAPLCMAMLREGSISKSALEINNALDFYGAFLELKSGLDNSQISLYARSTYLKNLIPVIADIFLHPLFDQAALDKHKLRMIQELEIDQKKTNYWAPRLLRKSLFGADHSYGKLVTEEIISSVTRDDLIQYHKNVIIPGLQNIIVAGAINQDEIMFLLNENLNYTAPKIQSVNNQITLPDKNKLITYSLKNTKQASIAIGKSTVRISEIDYSTSALVNKILGGYFGSRLMKKLREEEGLTYGIYAHSIHLQSGSYLQISADVELNSVDKSIDMIMTEIERIKEDTITNTELATVKNYMIGEYLADSNNVFDFSDLYKKLLFHNLPLNFYFDFYNKLSIITIDEIIETAIKKLNPSEFSIVKVG